MSSHVLGAPNSLARRSAATLVQSHHAASRYVAHPVAAASKIKLCKLNRSIRLERAHMTKRRKAESRQDALYESIRALGADPATGLERWERAAMLTGMSTR